MWEVARYEHPENIEDAFYVLLDKNLEIARKFLKRRYETIANVQCSTNPLAFTQGGLYKGFKSPEEKVGDLIQYMTASFGITALNELTQYAKGYGIDESNKFAKEVVQHIYDRVQQYKEEDGHLYALYGKKLPYWNYLTLLKGVKQ